MSRMRKLSLIILFALVTGCIPKPIILTQADPNPFIGQRRLAAQPIDFEGVRVGDLDEPRYLSGKNAEQRNLWTSDKGEFNVRYLEAVVEEAAKRGLEVAPAAQAPGAPFVVRLHAIRIVPGFNDGLVWQPGSVKLDMVVGTPDGRVLDHLVVEPMDATGYSVTSRMSNCGKHAGRIVVEYLIARAKPAPAR